MRRALDAWAGAVETEKREAAAVEQAREVHREARVAAMAAALALRNAVPGWQPAPAGSTDESRWTVLSPGNYVATLADVRPAEPPKAASNGAQREPTALDGIVATLFANGKSKPARLADLRASVAARCGVSASAVDKAMRTAARYDIARRTDKGWAAGPKAERYAQLAASGVGPRKVLQQLR